MLNIFFALFLFGMHLWYNERNTTGNGADAHGGRREGDPRP